MNTFTNMRHLTFEKLTPFSPLPAGHQPQSTPYLWPLGGPLLSVLCTLLSPLSICETRGAGVRSRVQISIADRVGVEKRPRRLCGGRGGNKQLNRRAIATVQSSTNPHECRYRVTHNLRWEELGWSRFLYKAPSESTRSVEGRRFAATAVGFAVFRRLATTQPWVV